MAAAQSPPGLGRFFGAKLDSPSTPGPRGGDSQATTPPGSIDAPHKRGVANAEADDDMPLVKKAKTVELGACSPVSGVGDREGGSPLSLERDNGEQLRDLQATLHHAQRAKPGQGTPPPFTAECIHHHNTGGHAYSWPSWLLPENIKDAEGRRPTDQGYNQSTLKVPNEAAQKLEKGHGTPMLLQYWKLKSAHFDKVALFKVGKFYEVFYYDAFIAQRVCDLKWMGEKKPHVGFPEMAKHAYAKKIVDAGFKVIIVEQVERVAEQQERKAEGNKEGPSCVERAPSEVFTSGTLVDPELLGGASARYMASFHFQEGSCSFSVCLVDCATSQMQVGTIQDVADRNSLRTFLAQVQPSEVVYNTANLPAEVMMIMKRIACQPQLSPYTNSRDAVMVARNTLGEYKRAHPNVLSEVVQAALSTDSAAIAAAGAISYLEGALLGRRVLPFAIWDVLPSMHDPSKATQSPSSAPAGMITSRLVLDAPALAALEVLETLDGAYKGSLLEFLDHTSTQFGIRLLKQWVCAPLFEVTEIVMRQEAIEFLIAHGDLAELLRTGLKRIPMDLERVTSRVWGYALQAERTAVMYEDVTAKRMGEFCGLLKAYEGCLQLVAKAKQGRALPGRLAQILRTRSDGGCLPDLQEVITRLIDLVVEDRSADNGKVKYRPRAGACGPYDQMTKAIEDVKGDLERELANLRANFPAAGLMFMHRLGNRYEVEGEVPALGSAFLKGVEETKRTGNKVRFHTPQIKALIEKLDGLEDRREDCVFPFLSRIFQDFHAHQASFRAAVRCLAELDSLLSLATASQGLSGASCRPEIVSLSDPAATGTLELRNCRHPVAASKMGAAFVPNDTMINVQGVPNVLVVTGPNMGGKSTVLRQTCLAVLMAQLGCRVNAEACRLSPVDRVFTRIGSYDAILEGKSTLLTELEETSVVIRYGSRRSLAVLDELGRGTSTFDGAAIASAVLDELARKVGCMMLFATHYHPISREAATWAEVAPYHMAAHVDEKSNEMTFLYRFLPGLCPASHGHHVARLAGLPDSVLQAALAKSAEFEGGHIASTHKELQSTGVDILRLAEKGESAQLRALFEGLRQSRAT